MRLSATIFFISAVFCHAAETVASRWEGTVQIPGRELKMIIDLAQANGGAWNGSIIIPGLAIKGVPLTDIVVKDSETTFTIKGTLGGSQVGPAQFKGRLNAKGALAGDFVQAGNSAPLILEKTGPPQVEVPPQSTAIGKELEGKWTGQFELFGYPRHVTINLINHPPTGATAEFVVVGKKTTNVPIDTVTNEGDFIRIESREMGINYEGRFGKEAGEIKGTFEQGPLELPLILRRTQ